MRHARFRRPLLDLGLFRLATYRSGILGGSLFRIGVGATPFLLPLMLRLGFGLSPLQSGLLTFASAAGAMFMNHGRAHHRRFWLPPRLLANAFVASAMLAAYGLFRPGTHLVVLAVLLAGGCFRSLQFTGLNAISYAEVDAARLGQASSMAGMMQQLSLSLGVAIGGYLLEAAGWLWQRPDTDVRNF